MCSCWPGCRASVRPCSTASRVRSSAATRCIRTVAGYVGEGAIAKDLGALQDRYPALEIGSYPFFRQGKFGASFVIRGTDQGMIDASALELHTIIRNLGAEPIDGDPAV